MLDKKINRRAALSSALGLGIGFGLTSIGNAEEGASESKDRKTRRSRKKESTTWKYVPIDPENAAQKAYEY